METVPFPGRSLFVLWCLSLNFVPFVFYRLHSCTADVQTQCASLQTGCAFLRTGRENTEFLCRMHGLPPVFCRFVYPGGLSVILHGEFLLSRKPLSQINKCKKISCAR